MITYRVCLLADTILSPYFGAKGTLKLYEKAAGEVDRKNTLATDVYWTIILL